MRSFVALAVRRRVAVLMCALAMAAFGIVGYGRLPLDLLPDISYPTLTIQTEFPDTAPAEVENLISRPIEETVGVLKGLRTVHSVSRAGVSEVTLEFEWDADMEMLSMDVREKLDRLVLPEEANDPIVLRFDPALDPIMRLALAGEGELTELRRLAEERLKQELETIGGVAAARVKGGLEEEIQINVDQERLAALGIPLAHVRQVIGYSNINLPGGSLRDEESQYLVRTVNEFDTVAEIAQIVIHQEGNAVVRLSDVAAVTRGTKEREEITRVNGRESVELAIYKEGDANIVTTARQVRERVVSINRELPPGTELALLFDQSRFIEQAVNEVRTAALVGGLLAIVVLLGFLRHARSTLIIATSIPISVLFAFLAMYRLDISLNIMSLGGLTLGVGMLVDNSIVVLEAIHRRRQAGLSLVGAAVEGTREVGGAVIASTLTTVAVFIPIVFVEGIAGELFGDMAMTVTLSLLASLLVAVTLIPMLSALGRDRRGTAAEAPDDGGARIMGSLGRVSVVYDRLLQAALRRSPLTLVAAAALFAGALLLVPRLETELIPAISEGEFFFEARLPEGTPLSVTDRRVQEMERIADRYPAIERHYATVGSRLVSGGVSFNTQAEHFGQLNVILGDRRDEEREYALAESLRQKYERLPDVEVKLGRPSYFSLRTPIEILLFGEDLDLLERYAAVLIRRLEAIPGVVDLRSSLEEGSPELQVVFDRDRLAALDLDLRTLSEALRDRIQGAVPTRFREADRQLDIRVRNQEVDRATLEDVRNLIVPGGEEPLRLLTLADVRIGRGPAEVHRVQQQRAAVISANLADRNLGPVVADIRQAIDREPPPRGVTVEVGGQYEEMQVSYASLRFALALAIFLVYLVMAATFESLLHPLIVIFSVPLALIGVVTGLLVTGTPISVIVLIGAVMLVGIVVNNAIVLIDKVNQLRRAGYEKRRALIDACHVRLRPILMTTLTTVLGLLPMSLGLGEGAELRAPLAITVSFGLLLSTLLTLVVIPTFYWVVPSRMATEEEESEAVGELRTAGEAE